MKRSIYKLGWLLICLCLMSCSHSQWVKDTYDPVTQKKASHEIISSTQVMYFSQRKDIQASYRDLAFNVGNTKQNPEFPPGFLDLFYSYLVSADPNILLERE